MPTPGTLDTLREQVSRNTQRPTLITVNMFASLAGVLCTGFSAAEAWPTQVYAARWLVCSPAPTVDPIVIAGFLNGVPVPALGFTIVPGTADGTFANFDESSFAPFDLGPFDFFRWDVTGGIGNAGASVALTLTGRPAPTLAG